MLEQKPTHPQPPISDGWGWFHSDNYYNPDPHDEQEEIRIQQAFARKAEAAIRAMFPENLAALAQQFEKFRGVNVPEVLRSAALLSAYPEDDESIPECFYSEALAKYKEVQSDDTPDLLDFALLVREFQHVANPIWENVKQFPADFFNLYHKSRDWLLEHVFEVIVDLLAEHLQPKEDDAIVESGIE